MKKILAKLLIALAFGVIVGLVAGAITQDTSYSIEVGAGKRMELSKSDFRNYADGSNASKITKTLNKNNVFFYGGIASSVLLIILMVTEIKSKKEEPTTK